MKKIDKAIQTTLVSVTSAIYDQKSVYNKKRAKQLTLLQDEAGGLNDQVTDVQKRIRALERTYARRQGVLKTKMQDRLDQDCLDLKISSVEQQFNELRKEKEPKIDALNQSNGALAQAIGLAEKRLKAQMIIANENRDDSINEQNVPLLIAALMEVGHIKNKIKALQDKIEENERLTTELHQPLNELLDQRQSLRDSKIPSVRSPKTEAEIEQLKTKLTDLQMRQQKSQDKIEAHLAQTDKKNAAFDSIKETAVQINGNLSAACRDYEKAENEHKEYHMETGENTTNVVTGTRFDTDDELKKRSIPSEEELITLVSKLYDKNIRRVTKTIVYAQQTNENIRQLRSKIKAAVSNLNDLAADLNSESDIPKSHAKQINDRIERASANLENTHTTLELRLKHDLTQRVKDELNDPAARAKRQGRKPVYGTRDENIEYVVQENIQKISKPRQRSGVTYTDERGEKEEPAQGRGRSGATRSHTPPNVRGGKG